MATLVRWDPFREMAQLQNELGRLLGGLTAREGDGGTSHWVPALDAWETEKELVYAFDLPGIPREAISIEFDDGVLTVTGERARASEVSTSGFHRFERRFGTFHRAIGVPQGVREENVSAEYRDGVLEVHVAKPEAPKPRRIQIGSEPGATIEGEAKQA